MDVNPYQVPVTAPPVQPKLRVDGKYLVVRSGTVLPPFCVKTNVPVQQEDIRQKRLTWCSPWVAALILINVLVLLIVYFIVRKHCLLTFGLSPEARRKYRNRVFIKLGIVAAFTVGVSIAALSDSAGVIVTMIIFLIIAVLALFIGNTPLTAAKHRDGEFWISGCSPEFLARISS